MNERAKTAPPSRRIPETDQPVPKIYAAPDNSGAWEDSRQDRPAPELVDLEYSLPKANGEDF